MTSHTPPRPRPRCGLWALRVSRGGMLHAVHLPPRPCPHNLLRRGQMRCGVLRAGSFVNEARTSGYLHLPRWGKGIKREGRRGGAAHRKKKKGRKAQFLSIIMFLAGAPYPLFPFSYTLLRLPSFLHSLCPTAPQAHGNSRTRRPFPNPPALRVPTIFYAFALRARLRGGALTRTKKPQRLPPLRSFG